MYAWTHAALNIWNIENKFSGSFKLLAAQDEKSWSTNNTQEGIHMNVHCKDEE